MKLDLLRWLDTNIDHSLCEVDSLLLICVLISSQSTLLEVVFVMTEGCLDEETELIFPFHSSIINCKELNSIKISFSCLSNSTHFKHLYT